MLLTGLPIVDVDPDGLAEAVSVNFLHCKVTLLTLFYTSLWKEDPMSSHTDRMRGYFYFLRAEYPHKFSGILSKERSVSSPLFIYFIIYLYSYELTDIYFLFGL